MIMNINWNAYRIFYYVATSGTTSTAARQLRIAQPAVSHSIKKLEEVLGCSLFVRTSRGMELTASGKFLLDHIADAVRIIETTETLMENERKAEEAEINIATVDVTMQYFLIPYLDAFEELNPEIRINIRNCKTVQDTRQLLDSKEVDFSVLHAPMDEEGGYESISIKQVQDVLVYCPRFEDCLENERLKAADLERYPMILHERDCASREFVNRYLEANDVTVKPNYEFSLNSSIIRQIKRKFGLAFLLEDVVREDVERGSLAVLDLDPPVPPRFFYLIKPKRVESKAARRLISFVLDSKPAQFK